MSSRASSRCPAATSRGPTRGRVFTVADGEAGSEPVLVLSYGFWRERFGASPDALGESLRVDGVPHRVIGVLPAGVHFPYAQTAYLAPVRLNALDAAACVPGAAAAAPAGAATGTRACAPLFLSLLERARALPGVQAAAFADSLPLTHCGGDFVFDAQGHPRSPRELAFDASGRVVTPGYFSALGIRLLRGRSLRPQDETGASRAVVISRGLAHRLWPNRNPIGRQIENVQDETASETWDPAKALTVVGVVGDTRDGVTSAENAGPSAGFGDAVYLPLTPARARPAMYVILRSQSGIVATASSLRAATGALAAGALVTRVCSMNAVVAGSMAASRSLGLLLIAFAGLALIIGGVGVYSLIAYVVGWRAREFGIRLALGAPRWRIMSAVLRGGLGLALSGVALGLTATMLLGGLLRRFLFGVRPLDPATFAAVALIMALLALVASWSPARRAARLDPVAALRLE